MYFIKDGKELFIYSAKFMYNHRVFIARRCTPTLEKEVFNKSTNKSGNFSAESNYILYTVDKYLRPDYFYARIYYNIRNLNKSISNSKYFEDCKRIKSDKLDMSGKNNGGIKLGEFRNDLIFTSLYNGNVLRKLSRNEKREIHSREFSNLYKDFNKKKISLDLFDHTTTYSESLNNFIDFLSYDKNEYDGENEILKFRLLNMDNDLSRSFIQHMIIHPYLYNDICYILDKPRYSKFVNNDIIASYKGIPHPNEYFFELYNLLKDEIVDDNLWIDKETNIYDKDIIIYPQRFITSDYYIYAKLKQSVIDDLDLDFIDR